MTRRGSVWLNIGARAARRAGLVMIVLGAGALPSLADADLSITNTSPGGVKLGANLVYTLTVQNAALADPAANVTVADPVPAGLTFVSFAGDCTGSTCSLGTLAPGDTRTVTATFTVPSSYSGVNPILSTASVSTTTTESNTANNSALAATAVINVAGFYPVSPCRIVDTRFSGGAPISGGYPLVAGSVLTADVRGACGLPGNATAISFNATVTEPTVAGNLRIYPGGVATPGTSALNYAAGQTRANNGIVPLSSDGKLSVYCGQAGGTTHFILDVNGYFAATDAVATPTGQAVVVRPAPEVEITFDNVTTAGTTTARVLDFADNRAVAGPQDLKDFFPPGSPERALVPSAIVPAYLVPLGKGGPGGTPTFVLSLIDSTAIFTRTAEFHGHEDFRLGWDPPCSNGPDRTQEPRTFYAREGNEPSLVEEGGGQPVFVDISSGCGSNKGSGWNFSAYLTARDTRSPRDIAHYMLTQMQAALTQLSAFIVGGVSTQIGNELTAALNTLDSTPTSSLTNVENVIAIVDTNTASFTDTTRNVSGELVGRALSARYMLRKFVGFDAYTEPDAFQDAIGGLTGKTTITFDNLGLNQTLPSGTALSGATFSFSAAGFSGVATPAFLSVSHPQTLGVNRGVCSAPFSGQNCWFFFPGESVTLTFATPVKAIGAFFSVNAGSATLQEFITISTPVGTAKSHNALPEGSYGFSAYQLRYVGLVSETPFSTATFSVAGAFGMVIDDITVAR
jgi:uncharacterized repeat protein (TIGR01451 family)